MEKLLKNTWAVLVAGGQGKRFGTDLPKQFLPLGEEAVLDHTVKFFLSLRSNKKLGDFILVLPEDFVTEWQEKLKHAKVKVTAGGETRQGSVEAGLACISSSAEYVVVHDGARPFLTEEIFLRTLQAAQEVGAAVTAIPVADTLKRANSEGLVEKTVDRSQLFRIQTPQVFSRLLLVEALVWAKENGVDATDEATLVEKMGKPVKLVLGSELNFKITRPLDLELARAWWEHSQQNSLMENKIMTQSTSVSSASNLRIGEGYDVHRWQEGRDLILGGVKVDFEKGLQGHSDADALSHAVGDALLGAAALGDLGQHFPDTDERFAGVSSLKLLEEIIAKLKVRHLAPVNVDATLICQRPKLAEFIPAMRKNLAEVLGLDLDQVSVKATTEEGLGFTGEMQGLAARAVVLLYSA